MTDHPAGWRMPTVKQMDAMATAVGRTDLPVPALAPQDELPPEYWQSLLDSPPTDTKRTILPASALPLSKICEHVLRVDCRRCGRTVEIQTLDAVRLYGERAIWKDVGQRLLNDTCMQRTGRYEEDGCWPSCHAP